MIQIHTRKNKCVYIYICKFHRCQYSVSIFLHVVTSRRSFGLGSENRSISACHSWESGRVDIGSGAGKPRFRHVLTSRGKSSQVPWALRVLLEQVVKMVLAPCGSSVENRKIARNIRDGRCGWWTSFSPLTSFRRLLRGPTSTLCWRERPWRVWSTWILPSTRRKGEIRSS